MTTIEQIKTHSTEETIAAGTSLAHSLRSGDIVALCGPMGAGKTYLAKGIVRGLTEADVNEVTSPAYDLVHEFGDTPRVFHYDLFRLERLSEEDVEWLMESFSEDGIHVVEWGDRLKGMINKVAVRIELCFGSGDDEREISVKRFS